PLIPRSFCFSHCSAHHRDLHSFPTRRSSDLRRPAVDYWERAIQRRDRRTRQSHYVVERHEDESRLESQNGNGAWPASRRRLFCADRKSTRLNSSHSQISYAVFCLKKKKKKKT